MFLRPTALAVALLCAVATAHAADAPSTHTVGAIEVSPIVQVNSLTTRASSYTLTNRTGCPVREQMRVMTWTGTSADGARVESDTSDVQIRPAIVTIPDQGTQIARVIHVAPPGAREEQYRVHFDPIVAPGDTCQGAVPAAAGKISALVTLVQHIDVPLFYRGADMTAHVTAAWQGTKIVLRNDGTATAKIWSIGDGKQVWNKQANYVLPGQSGTFETGHTAPAQVTLVMGDTKPVTTVLPIP
ncbi:MAG TPA: fimbria/pilus periplasmic chaperone [Dyella sp.]|uniref:fimbrial biogenesis chaperone n=1 Tax=Dyella sp. TaxID=1869338 RepID=UPI002D1958E0|nr:fimbria/pilus periplasmic chaperone [Dyella sp.]HTV84204.1 fimbria/pilus periplasmic chaperone [Dyella sp.]